MEKKIIQKTIFWMTKEKVITWKDIKHIEFQDNDEIGIQENDDGSFYACVLRHELETDEEFEERKKILAKMREISRERRYQKYLSLKEEFEK